MYEEFYGLRERPFDLVPDPRFLVLTDSHEEVLSTLKYGIASRKGITLLTGEAGSGKTTLLRAAIAAQPSLVHCVHLHNPMLTRDEFVEMLANRFDLSERAVASKTSLLLELETLLRKRREAGETTVLLIDEAQSLPLDLLEEVRLLANIETDSDRLLSVIIAGQPELADRLNESGLRQFKQRVALRCQLRALTVQETAGYLAGRIFAAGGVGSAVFTRDAVAVIYEHSAGIPRTISVIADNALLGGFASGTRPVVSAIVREVCRDFDLKPIAKADELPAAPSADREPITPIAAETPVAANGAGRLSSRSLFGRAKRVGAGDGSAAPAEPAANASMNGPAAVPEGTESRPAAVSDAMFGTAVAKKRRFLFFGS